MHYYRKEDAPLALRINSTRGARPLEVLYIPNDESIPVYQMYTGMLSSGTYVRTYVLGDDEFEFSTKTAK